MRVARIQWPDDLNEAERGLVSRLEERVRLILTRISMSAGGYDAARLAFEALDAELFANTRGTAAAFGNRLRIVTDVESTFPSSPSNMGIRVRFTWTAAERQRRDAERRARESAEEQSRRRANRREERATDRMRAAHRMTPEQWGTARDAGGTCLVCNASPDMWCDQVVHRAPASLEAASRSYGGSLVVSATDLATSRDLDLMRRQLEEVERLSAMGLERQANELFATAVEDAPRAELREFRREVLGEFVPPSSRVYGAISPSDVSALRAAGVAVVQGDTARVADAMIANMRATMPDTATGGDLRLLEELVRPGGRPYATFIAQQLPVTLEAVLRGWVARRRGPAGSGDVSEPVRGDDERGLEALIASRRPGDTFYFVAAPPDLPTYMPHPTFKAEGQIPGSVGEAIARARSARAREGLELLVRIVSVALRAREEAYSRALWFYAFARAALEPWARNPSPIELDIDRAPFGVDLEPAEDPTAARFALLELERD